MAISLLLEDPERAEATDLRSKLDRLDERIDRLVHKPKRDRKLQRPPLFDSADEMFETMMARRDERSERLLDRLTMEISVDVPQIVRSFWDRPPSLRGSSPLEFAAQYLNVPISASNASPPLMTLREFFYSDYMSRPFSAADMAAEYSAPVRPSTTPPPKPKYDPPVVDQPTGDGDVQKFRSLQLEEKVVTNRGPDGRPLAFVGPELQHRCGSGTHGVYQLRDRAGNRVDSLHFQDRPLDAGITGWTNEALVEVLFDRFVGFQSGPNPNEHNVRALNGLLEVRQAMRERVAERNAAGVRGTHEPAATAAT